MSRVYTEKTWKVITNFHPFLLVGTLDSIKGLQEMGFETFPEMFDESYDSEAALEDKLPKICNQIEKVCLLTQSQLNNVYCSMEEKLVYNFHHFFRLCENEIDELEKYLLKFCNS